MINSVQTEDEAPSGQNRVIAPRPRRKTGPTIRDVAAASGVSVMTVSAVLNNRQGEFSEKTRERVVSCIRSLNYQPSAAARALSRKRSDTIGIVFGIVGAAAAVTNPYMSGILEGVLLESSKFGLDVNMVNRHWYSAEVSAVSFKDERTDGILVIAPRRDSDIVKGLADLGRPLVTVSGDARVYGIPSVDTDDSAVGVCAVKHLVSLGHRRIAHITGNYDLTSTHRRLASYIAEMTAVGLPTPLEYVVRAEYSGDGASDAVAQLLKLPEPPTAIFCGNDNIAFATMRALIDMQRAIPGDISVVGVDDVDAAARVTPPLTTVRQSLQEIGVQATSLLIALIDGRPQPAVDHLIPPQLIVRRSTGPAPR